jgi:YVTN family beta-propeller protein
VTADFQTGQRFGAYILGDLLGRGGMGVVYEAQHVHLGRKVALKLLAPEWGQSDDFRARFLRESRLAATLEHPGIVTVYDAGEVDGVLYLAMRFVPGTDLAALLAQRVLLPPGETLSIVGQVASALDAAHAAGLVHRDVKPANVMIEGDRSYLTDFGLTKRTTAESHRLTATGQFFGTVDYVAPEQIQGAEQDGRVDVYALGCVLFECLTGSRPYPRDSQLSVIYAHLREPPPRATQLRPELPPGIDVVIATAMAKAPEQRYPTCMAMVEAAGEAMSGRATAPAVVDQPTAPFAAPTGALDTGALPTAPLPPEAPPTKAPPPETRRRGPLAAAAVLVLLGAAAAVAILALSGGSTSNKTAATTKASSAAPGAPDPNVVGTPLHVGERPIGIVSRNGFLWVADNARGKVIRIRPDGSGRKEIAVGRGPFDMASNTTSVWAANSQSHTVTRIETATARAGPQVPVGATPLFLTAEDDFVYVSNSGDDTVTVVDARTGQPAGAAVRVGKDPRGIGANGRVAFVVNHGSDTVSRIENGQVTQTIPVGQNPVGIAARKDAIWVANEGDDTVSRIDAGTGRVTSTRVGSRPYAVGFDDPYMWVADRGSNDVVRLDPKTGRRVGRPIPIPGEPVNMTQADGFLWVTAAGARTVTQLKP